MCICKKIGVPAPLTVLHPHGPSSSFKYPAHEDVHTIAFNSVLLPVHVDPRTGSGRIYTLTREELKMTVGKFKEVLMMDS